ncbi:MAG: AMP-binding protein [Acidobacteriota bacterium]
MTLPPSRAATEADQLQKLRRLLGALIPDNAFYARRLRAAGLDGELPDLDTFRRRMPRTTKQELAEDQRLHPPYGSGLTFPLENYSRFHQTSGTSGQPMSWLDTPESWAWMVSTWRRVFEASGVTAQDRVLFPFSFGPFLGFWTAFDAAEDLGCLVLAGGGLSSSARLELIRHHRVTALCLTPTYALRLGEVAAESASSDEATGQETSSDALASVRTLVVAGEPGGSLQSTRAAIESRWPEAKVYDHHGMTEVGPVSYPNRQHPGVLHVLESAYFAEVLDPDSGQEVGLGEEGELTLTTLGRIGSPLLRYRTGDLVKRSASSAAELGSTDLALEGGILTRLDDMVVVRGVNLYPAAVEEVLRTDSRVAEFRVEHRIGASLGELQVVVEPTEQNSVDSTLASDLTRALKDRFQLRMDVQLTPPGSLPRFEMKARRWRSS